jgi:hypothetical protein
MAPGRLAILNGFGRSLGDSLIGLQALRAAQSLTGMPVPTLIRRHYNRPLVDQLYTLAADFAHVTIVPDNRPDNAPDGFDRVIDMRDFAFDPAFRGVSMIDFFLTRLGLDPALVPAAQKRNLWLRPRITTTPATGLPLNYALVCPGSSMPMRDMPALLHALVLRRLQSQTDLAAVTQGQAVLPGTTSIPALDSIQALCSLVAHARLIVSTDTAMVHLADAFDIPCFSVFTTHRPEWRVRDYPGCDPLHLPVPNLPEALEFARDPMDIQAASQAWLDGEAVIQARLDAFLNATLEKPRAELATG